MAQVSTSLRRPLGPARFSDARGLTLVEVIAAAFVLVFAITSSLIALQSGFRALDLSRGITLASQVVQGEIERVRLLGSNEIEKISQKIAAKPNKEPEQVTFSEDDKDIERRFDSVTLMIEQHKVGATEVPGMWNITVTAQWRTVDNIVHTRSTSTRYCRSGLYDFFATDPNPSS